MRQLVKELERGQLRSRIPDFDVGDTVRVSVQIIEGQKTRLQDFEGTVIARKHKGARETFTVRKISSGVGVERIFPLHSPRIVGIKVIRKGDVRRAKLYYLRKRVGKKARIRERVMTAEELRAARDAEAALGVEPADGEGIAEAVAESEPADAEKSEAEVTEPAEEPAAIEEAEEPRAESEPAEAEEPEAEAGVTEPAEEAAVEEGGDTEAEPEAEEQAEPEEKDEEVKVKEAEEDTPKDA